MECCINKRIGGSISGGGRIDRVHVPDGGGLHGLVGTTMNKSNDEVKLDKYL